jgi:DNA ligase-1
MNRFAALLDRLAYEPRRNAKLRLLMDYFRHTPDPDRGYALAAMTNALMFKEAKPGLIRGLVEERTDPVLFRMSYHYVGDLAETAALIWPAPGHESVAPADAPGGGEPSIGHNNPPPHVPSITEVVETLATTSKSDLPARVAGWLDALDETGRWALIKLITRELRVGVSARLAKTAVAQLGGFGADEVELIWHGLEPPYENLFAWVEGRAEKPESGNPAPFRPPMLSHPLEDEDFERLDASDFMAEWKWDGIRLQAVAGHAGSRPPAGRPRAARSDGSIRAPGRMCPAPSRTWWRPWPSREPSMASCSSSATAGCRASTCSSSASTGRP